MTEPKTPETPRKWQRSNFVPAPHFFQLNQACFIINQAFGRHGCYLVGSALVRRDYRDVDVRYIMGDDAYDRLFKSHDGWLNPLWSLMCTSISLWLRQQTELPIDFQIQRQSQANAQHDDGRHAIGIFLDPREEPAPSPSTAP